MIGGLSKKRTQPQIAGWVGIFMESLVRKEKMNERDPLAH